MAFRAFDEIADDMAFIDEWEDRYRYIIDLGKDMPGLEEGQKLDVTKVDGCASQVWIVPEVLGSETQRQLRFSGDSDAVIVRGLIAVLLSLFNDKTSHEILSIDAAAEFERLGLSGHLSAQRSNGLRAMMARIKSIAQMIEEQSA